MWNTWRRNGGSNHCTRQFLKFLFTHYCNMSLYVISLDDNSIHILGWVELNEAKPNTQAADSKDMHKYKDGWNGLSKTYTINSTAQNLKISMIFPLCWFPNKNTQITLGERYDCNSINTTNYIFMYGAKTEKITSHNTFSNRQHMILIWICQWNPLS